MGKRFLAVVVVVASACTALHYSWTAQSSVVVSHNPYTFDGPGSQIFVISPAGSGDDLLQSITMMQCNSQWSLDTTIDVQQPVMGARVCSAGTMPSGSGSALTMEGGGFAACPANYQFKVVFAGTQPGTSSCNVLIEYMPAYGGAKQTVGLGLTGIGSGSNGITVTPTEIDFGDVQINTTSDPAVRVTVKNIGTVIENVSGVLSGSGFIITPPPGNTIGMGPGSSATFDVRCMPTVLGKHAGTLTFNGNSNSVATSLQCTGINSTISVSPTQVIFDDTLVGSPPPTQTVRISGGSAATIDEVSLDNDAIAAGVSITVNPQGQTIGSGQMVVLAYAAEAAHPGGPLGTLTLKVSTDNDPRAISISGQALLGGVGTNPASVELGAVCVGARATKDVEVYASEAGDIVVSELMPPSSPFSIEPLDELPMTLAGNHTGPSAFVRVSMEPTSAGDFTSMLGVQSNVPGQPTTEVGLHGIGIESGIAATPNVVHFGTAPMGTTTSIKQVQLTNCGTSDLMFEKAQIVGTDAADFTLIGANPPRTLAPTESEIFMVVMQPKSPGFKTAQLVLTHDGGTTTADLDGTGEGELDITDRETYYACSTGRGATAWPLALALLALRRRRRR